MADSAFFTSLLAGAAAGVSVDVSLYPLDTIKTRAQAAEGFWKAGGFKGVYNGLGSAALGSAPGAALFFSTYDTAKSYGLSIASEKAAPFVHMAAASLGEVVACLVRVPTENIKQKQQAGIYKSLPEALAGVRASGGLKAFYVGYGTTVAREIPFSFIQFPLWEGMKGMWSRSQGSPVAAYQAALCGSVAGGFAAAVTTPLDVAKTRQMLDVEGTKYRGMVRTMQRIHMEEGRAALFSGVGPRTMWISIGGFVFFYAYEATKRAMSS